MKNAPIIVRDKNDNQIISWEGNKKDEEFATK
jgi:hypothetical protein